MNVDRCRHTYEDELLGSVIPFWEKNCQDREFGGYFTSLDRDGSVYDTRKYMWMQWRIVYMFATLFTSLYGGKGKWLDIAIAGFDFLVRNGKSKDGHYYFALNRDGTPAVAPYSIFSDCFAAMGAAALHKATGEIRYRKEAEDAMNSYVGRMDNPKLQWEKNLPGNARRHGLGQYMILANLGLVMKDCLGTDAYEKEVAAAVDTVMGKFWNPQRQVIFENVNEDGSFDLDSCEGRHITPGHGLESMWFILKYAELNGRPDLIKPACEAIAGLLEFGWDKENGGIYYFMDVLDKPHIELQANMKLWWVHNEALLAILYAYRITGTDLFQEWFEKVDAWTWTHFPDKKDGEWFGYLDRRGNVTHTLKGGKWKTFFHLPRFLLEGIGQLDRIGCAGSGRSGGIE
jgi:N-acylglucosamine 2-epimerase